MDKVVVCVHGRNQQWILENEVLADFQGGIIEGLGRLPDHLALSSEQIVLAFYGDLFLPDAAPPAAFGLAGGHTPEPAFQVNIAQAMLQEAAKRGLAVDDETLKLASPSAQPAFLTWENPFVYALLQIIDQIIGAPREILRLFISDVDQYLHIPLLRERVMARLVNVLQQQQGKEIVVVAHSLGSVVAYDVLNTHPEIAISSFVTLGSPLGLSPFIYNALLPEIQDPQKHPFPASIAGNWSNFYDPQDIVALVPILGPLFPGASGQSVVSTPVQNNPDDRHSLIGYLIQMLVAQAINNALAGKSASRV